MKRKNFKLCLVGLLLVSLMLCYGSMGLAAEYPTRPINLIINFSVGGTSDIAIRTVVRKVAEEIEQPIICKNVTGAGGTLGVATVARAKPDGYTIGTCNMPSVCIHPQLRKLPYDPFEDIVQLGVVMPYEYCLAVRGDAPWNTWEEFVNYVKENPGIVTYGSCGTGTTNHLLTARIGVHEDFNWIHVPFKGGAPETAALLGGHVTIINNTFVSMLSPIRAGKIKVLLITSKRRIPVVPNVPTMIEKGYPFFQASYMSLIAPKDIPESARKYLEQVFEKAVNDLGVQEELRKLTLNPEWMSGEEYGKLARKLYIEWGEMLKKLELIK